MILLRLTLGILIAIAYALPALAGPCDQLINPKTIVACALENHPAMKRGQAWVAEGSQLESQAAQRPNPELSSKAVFGQSLGDNTVSTEVNLTHTFELGGKRGARIERARSESAEIQAQYLKTKEEVFVETLRTLYRIRQVHSELATIEEALRTFSRIQKQYSSRPHLAPEQEVSLSVFQLAEADYQLRRNTLKIEESTLEKSIEIATGSPFRHLDSLLPLVKSEWPEVSNTISNFKNSTFQLAQADLLKSQAALEVAKSDSWPELKLGPSLQSQTQGPITSYAFGLNLSLPLPLFHANGGGRAVSQQALLKSEISLGIKSKELSNEASVWKEQYQRTVTAIKEALPLNELEKRHQGIERLFDRGVVSASLVIEAHRQMVDFTKSRNDHELLALDALWKLLILQGSLFEGEL